MALANVNIKLENGALGRAAASADGVAGLILTGAAEGSLLLNKVYQLASIRDLTNLGATEAGNPLVYKDVAAFYKEAGDGAELHLIVVAPATTLTAMCGVAATSALRKLRHSSESVPCVYSRHPLGRHDRTPVFASRGKF